ncbi:hypothetical protein [Streptomyces sp. NPDC006551]|uniref:hypothetical protein n=1 Tax=Streptomyces sp. NPDC006551 TaxID=3157178 RepID=UPI0033A33335
MAAHAATPTRRHHRRRPTTGTTGTTDTTRSARGWMLPVVLGVIYGLYASTVARHGGPLTWGQAVLGVVSAAVVAVAFHALRRWQRALPRELRAVAWGSMAGIAIGFLFSLSNASVLSAVVLALLVGAGVFCVAFYLFYTHEDATGRPLPRS